MFADEQEDLDMLTINDNAALLIIDAQMGLDDPGLGRRNNPMAEANMARLLARWRELGRPIFHIQHMSTEPDSPLRPELPGNAIKAIVAPNDGEPVIQKRVNSAFIGTDLEERLRQAGIATLVLVGLTTDHCVSSTARMAGDLGFQTAVIADATAAHEVRSYDGRRYSAETVHALALANLHDEFAAILTTAQALERDRTMPIRIRRAEPAEAEKLSEIARLSKAHWGYSEAQIEEWRESFLTVSAEYIQKHSVWVAAEGDVIAFAALEQDDGGAALEHLWVLPAYIGQGIGRRLFLHVARQAAEFTFTTDPHADGFYRKLGAIKIGEVASIYQGRSLSVFRYQARS